MRKVWFPEITRLEAWRQIEQAEVIKPARVVPMADSRIDLTASRDHYKSLLAPLTFRGDPLRVVRTSGSRRER